MGIKNNQKFIGKKIRFIVNSVRERQNDFLIIGKSFEEKTVCVTQKKSDNIKVRGDWSWAEITSVSPLSLTGRIIKK
jgi:tRNA A37 methylthiotransferase MiaB